MSNAGDFSDFLAPGVSAADLPELERLQRARPLLAAFTTLFHGSEAEVLLRIGDNHYQLSDTGRNT